MCTSVKQSAPSTIHLCQAKPLEAKRAGKNRIPINTSAQNSCATTQLIMYHADWKRLETTVPWILKVETALLELSRKRKQLLLDNPTHLNYVLQEMSKAKCSLKQDLSTEDLSAVETALIQFCQKRKFYSKMSALLFGNPVKRSSPIYRLNPVFEDGLLRVGGRLSRTARPEGKKASHYLRISTFPC